MPTLEKALLCRYKNEFGLLDGASPSKNGSFMLGLTTPADACTLHSSERFCSAKENVV